MRLSVSSDQLLCQLLRSAAALCSVWRWPWRRMLLLLLLLVVRVVHEAETTSLPGVVMRR